MMDTKKALITGAASGIGAAAARRFAREGWDVIINDLSEAGLAGVHKALAPGDHLICPGDYTAAETAECISSLIGERFGRLDALVNCAGVFMPSPVIDSQLDQWRRPMDIMIDGAVNMTRLSAKHMKSGGRIVHITSIHGERAEVNSSAYAMAKSALNQYCRALAVELASRNILVNAIAPGFVDTPMNWIDGRNEIETEWFNLNYITGHHLPLRRAAAPEEIAGVALFLAGPDASYITGQVITVDGGLTITF